MGDPFSTDSGFTKEGAAYSPKFLGGWFRVSVHGLTPNPAIPPFVMEDTTFHGGQGLSYHTHKGK